MKLNAESEVARRLYPAQALAGNMPRTQDEEYQEGHDWASITAFIWLRAVALGREESENFRRWSAQAIKDLKKRNRSIYKNKQSIPAENAQRLNATVCCNSSMSICERHRPSLLSNLSLSIQRLSVCSAISSTPTTVGEKYLSENFFQGHLKVLRHTGLPEKPLLGDLMSRQLFPFGDWCHVPADEARHSFNAEV